MELFSMSDLIDLAFFFIIFSLMAYSIKKLPNSPGNILFQKVFPDELGKILTKIVFWGTIIFAGITGILVIMESVRLIIH